MALGLLLFLQACQTHTPTPVPVPVPTPDAASQRLGRALMESQREREGLRHALRGRSRVSLDGAVNGSFSKQVVLLERPARLRLEVIGLLNQRVAILATDGDRYALFRRESPELERGAVHPGVLWEVAGVPLTPELAVALLLGLPPVPEPDAPFYATRDGGAVEVNFRGVGDSLRSFHFDTLGRLVAFRLAGSKGELLLDVRYGDFRDVGDGSFAHNLELSFPEQEAKATVAFREVELNPEIAPELFELSPGSG